MTRTIEKWPDLSDYQGPIANPRQCLKDPRLQAMQVEMKQGTRQPKARSGGFGGVYKFSGGRQVFAVKVFTKHQSERDLRYRLLSEHLRAQRGLLSLVSFDYQQQGILCNSRWWPTLVMPWVEGRTLDSYLADTLNRNGRLDNALLCRAWVDLMLDLERCHIAHGDLQQGNILVLADGRLQLVDYDGMFVPAIRGHGLGAMETGLPAFQHPQRAATAGYFNERLDDFAALVILLTLACLDRDLWGRYNRGNDKCLIFREEDWKHPDQSPLLEELSLSPAVPVAKLARILRAAARRELADIPRFSQVVADGRVKEVLADSWPPPGRTTGKKPARALAPTCRRCKASLRPGDRFCRRCGTAINATRPVPKISTWPKETKELWIALLILAVLFSAGFWLRNRPHTSPESPRAPAMDTRLNPSLAPPPGQFTPLPPSPARHPDSAPPASPLEFDGRRIP